MKEPLSAPPALLLHALSLNGPRCSSPHWRSMREDHDAGLMMVGYALQDHPVPQAQSEPVRTPAKEDHDMDSPVLFNQ
jgi:hypothetical protein